MNSTVKPEYGDIKAAATAVGYLMIMLGAIILVPLFMLIPHPEEVYQAPCFILPGVLSIFTGYLIKLFTGPSRFTHLKQHSGSLIVLAIWLVSSLIGSIPFLLTGEFNFSQAMFESISGFTTTGFTVTDVANATSLILLYRSMLHLVGGVGLVLVMTSILSDVYGMQLFSAEGHTDRLTPNPLHSARTILSIYLGFIIGGTVLYTFFGMSLFDAVNYSISAVATGGFSTDPSSIGTYNSVPINITSMVLMLLGGTNFMASMYFLKGRWSGFFGHVEVRCTAILIGITAPIVTVMLLVNGISNTIPDAIDHACFQVISILTTTGLSTIDDFLPRASFALFPLVLLMFVGGHSDSTAGGLKSYRAALAAKSIGWDVRENLTHPRITYSKKISRFGKQEPVSSKEQSQNYTYIFLYLGIVFLGTFGLCLCGYSFRDSFVEFSSALGTVGMSIGIVSRTTGAPALWILMIGMLLARLEVYIIIFGFARLAMDVRDIHRRRKYAPKHRIKKKKIKNRKKIEKEVLDFE